MSKDFDYDKAKVDLYDSGCPHASDIYGYRSEKGIDSFMKENGLNPDNYRTNSSKSHSSKNDDEGCYLTTACTVARNLADDCDELQTLRHYRDTYLKERECGAEDIAYYYKVAPKIVESISGRQNAAEIWEELYTSMVCPCVDLIKNGEPESAYEIYKRYTLQLEKEYLPN